MSEKKKSVFGIWKKEIRNSKTGQLTHKLTFSVDGVRYEAWENTYKTKDNQPDYNVYLDTYVKPSTQTAPAFSKAPVNTPMQSTQDSFSDTDLPF